jgi:hypothetical protein
LNSHIYKLTDLRNNKIYIGQHNGENKSYFTGGIIPKRIIKKHGKGVFKKEIIVEGNFNQELLNQLEIHYVRLFASNLPQIGYNLNEGGGAQMGFKHSEKTKKHYSSIRIGSKNPNYGKNGELSHNYGKKHTEKTKKKMSESHNGKTFSKETRGKMSYYASNRSESHLKNLSKALTGKVLSKETRKKISNINRGKIVSKETRKKMSESAKKYKKTEEHLKNIRLSFENMELILCENCGNKFKKFIYKRNHGGKCKKK